MKVLLILGVITAVILGWKIIAHALDPREW